MRSPTRDALPLQVSMLFVAIEIALPSAFEASSRGEPPRRASPGLLPLPLWSSTMGLYHASGHVRRKTACDSEQCEYLTERASTAPPLWDPC
eukprot:2719570-Prymnesium_polylepis.1